MRLPTLKRVLKEDVKGAPSWANPLLNTLNSFMETVYQGFNKNITFSENIGCSIRQITYNTPSTYPTGVEPIRLEARLKVKATGVLLMQIYDRTNYTPPDGPVYIPWTEDNGEIVLGTITGLDASKSYILRLLII